MEEKEPKIFWNRVKKNFYIKLSDKINGIECKFKPTFKKMSLARVFYDWIRSLDKDKYDKVMTKEISVKEAGWTKSRINHVPFGSKQKPKKYKNKELKNKD